MPSWVGVWSEPSSCRCFWPTGFCDSAAAGSGLRSGLALRRGPVLIVVATAIVSTAVGLLLVAASHHVPAAYVGLVVPGGLWLAPFYPQHDRHLVPKPLAAGLTLPLGRLYDRMGDDMENWCDTRLRAASQQPQWISDAAKYYFNQVGGRIKDSKPAPSLTAGANPSCTRSASCG